MINVIEVLCCDKCDIMWCMWYRCYVVINVIQVVCCDVCDMLCCDECDTGAMLWCLWYRWYVVMYVIQVLCCDVCDTDTYMHSSALIQLRQWQKIFIAQQFCKTMNPQQGSQTNPAFTSNGFKPNWKTKSLTNL